VTSGQPPTAGHQNSSLVRPDGVRGLSVPAWRGIPVPWRLTADVAAALLLLGATLVFYFPLVFLGRALVDYDAFVYFYPQRVYLGRALLEGRLPLWNPDLFLGAPFLANPQTAVLYPPSWLFLIGPVHAMYTLQLVLHAFLAAVFTYLLMRRAFQAHPAAAAVGALSYAFGGFAVGQVGHLNQISAAAWLPGVLLAYDRFVALRQPRWIALGALALALQLLAGHPQETYMTLIVLSVFALVGAPWQQPRGLLFVGLGGLTMCILGAVLAAAQLLPTLELAPLSIRGEGVNWKDAVAGSLPSYLAIRALFPPFWLRVPNTEFLGYAGVVALVLGLLAVLQGRARPVLFGCVVCGLGLFLALGENNGFYPLVFFSVPGFDTFRVPARWLLVWEFGAAVLAAVGADWIARGANAWLRQRTTWLRAALVAMLLMTGLAWQLQEGEELPQRRTPVMWTLLAAATLAAGTLPHLGRQRLAMGALVVLAGSELWAAADASPARQAPRPVFRSGETVEWLHSQGVTNSERLLSLARPEYVPALEPQLRMEMGDLAEPLQFAVLVAQKWHDTLTPNVPLQYGLSTADGYDGGVLPLLRWVRLSRLLVPDPRPDGVLLSRLESVPDARMLDLLGVRYVIANQGIPGQGDMRMVDFGDLRLYSRAESPPRSLLIYQASRAGDDQQALDRMALATFNPSSQVVISDGRETTSAREGQPVQPDVQAAERWRARVSLPEPGYLVQREAWYPSWRARVDGVDTPVVRADVLFRAVPVPAGNHQVELFFDSTSFVRGAWLSAAGLIIAIGLLSIEWLPILRTRVLR
jgi:hypothetical protein